MELSWTTFILEVINFLVLVWVLKRLFYIPIKRTIAARRAAVEKTLRDAESTKREAQDLQSKYDGRLRGWELEKERQKEEFRKELNEERARQLKLIESSVAQEREKMEAQEEKKAAERRENEEREAMNQALDFTSRLLSDVACPELEGKIVELVTKQLSSTLTEALRPSAPRSGDPEWLSVCPIRIFLGPAATGGVDRRPQRRNWKGDSNRVQGGSEFARGPGNYDRDILFCGQIFGTNSNIFPAMRNHE